VKCLKNKSRRKNKEVGTWSGRENVSHGRRSTMKQNNKKKLNAEMKKLLLRGGAGGD
jgi:hypothetical protein